MRGKSIFVAFVLMGEICFAQNLVGQDAPPLVIRQWITENPPDITNLSGRVYVLEFWATWCTPCKENIPHLIEFNKKYKESGVVLIALSQDKSVDLVSRFVQDRKISYPVAIDNGTVDRYGINAYPTIVVVNHKGKVIWNGYPWQSEFEEAVSKAVKDMPPPLLADVDLGHFSRFKKYLSGGNEFARVYHEIALYINNENEPQIAQTAKRIVETINAKISRKISEADYLRSRNPLEAYYIYEDLVTRYDGIEPVIPARQAYYELKKLKLLNKIP